MLQAQEGRYVPGLFYGLEMDEYRHQYPYNQESGQTVDKRVEKTVEKTVEKPVDIYGLSRL